MNEQLRDDYYERTNKRIEEFAKQIPFNILFDYIKAVTRIDDLKFDIEIKKDRNGIAKDISFESQDLYDKVGFLQLIFKEIRISNFNSTVYVDSPDYKEIDYSKDYPICYWCTVDFSYEHQSGGSNGSTFLHASYKNNRWDFRLDKH